MKAAILIVLQFLLFLAAFAAGIIIGVFSPLHLRWFMHPATVPGNGPSYFDPSGLLLAVILYLLILAIQAARKSLRISGLRTTIAFGAALIVGFLFRFGFVG